MSDLSQKRAIIIGAGPAGLTAALELLKKKIAHPIVLELSGEFGGISRTVQYHGNRMDLGGHRFFSKSGRVMEWWLDILPLQGAPSRDDLILGRELPHAQEKNAPDPEQTDRVMLIRNRLSRIFFLRRFFDYPVSLNWTTIKGLGLWRITRVGLSYVKARLFPIKPERSLEDFFINRFGRELYSIFFKDYTEKVWGVPCHEIKPEWGSQRIKGLSVIRAILHALNKSLFKNKSLDQKQVETSLIERFYYPKYGPGQMWERVAELIKEKGGEFRLFHLVTGIETDQNRLQSVTVKNLKTGQSEILTGDYFFSSMPVVDLVAGLSCSVPEKIWKIAQGLRWRNFITVGLLLKKLKIKNNTKIKTIHDLIPDVWIYIQERDVKLGRLQVFNNWSPYLVKDPDTVWLGLEYFCDDSDDLWNRDDRQMAQLAVEELAKIDMIETADVLDQVVIRQAKTYPAYFGTYDQFPELRQYLDQFENLFLIGRNGMHRYNNMDHSMLTAMTAVDAIAHGIRDKESIWAVNAEEDYHEEKK
jgi:protoporphyrinogen oxidase